MILLRKKKDKESDYVKILAEFNSDMCNIKTANQYYNIKKSYRYIKTYYENKIKNKDFDINIEKFRVERNLGIQPNKMLSFSIDYYVAFIGIIFYFIFQSLIVYFDKYSKEIGMVIASLLAILYLIARTIGKDIIRDKPRNLMLNISLRVLEDLEKEITEVKFNKINQITQDEVAVTNIKDAGNDNPKLKITKWFLNFIKPNKFK